MKLKQGILWMLTLFTTSMSAQDVQVSAAIDKQGYLIGDYIRLHITASTDSLNQLFWPAAEAIAPFDIISANPIDTAREKNNLRLSQTIVYSIYDSGAYTIPAITFQYKKAGNQLMNAVTTDSIRFMVNTVAVDTTTAIKPIKTNINVKAKSFLWLYILIGLVILATIGLGIYFTFFTKKSIRSIIPKPKPKPLHEATLEKLKKLDEKKLWQKEEIKQYYIELTDILRVYMEKRFHMHAMESTSDEIISQLTHADLPQKHVTQIGFILDVADMAKFAKSKPLPNENTLAMNYAVEFIEATKPIEITETKK